MSEHDSGGTMTSGRIQMLQMQLKAALRDAEEAERAAELPSLDEAREQLSSRLEPLMAERRRALDAQLDQARAGAQEQIEQARAEAEQVVAEAERVAAEAAAEREAERVAAEEAERVAAEAAAEREAERVAAEEAERVAAEEAERVAAEKAERVAAEKAERVAAEKAEPVVDEAALAALLAADVGGDDEPSDQPDLTPQALVADVDEPASTDSEPLPVVEPVVSVPVADIPLPPVQAVDPRDDIWRQVPPVPPQREVPLPVAVAPAAAPAQVVVDAEAFARVFATVLAEVLGQRGIVTTAAPMVHQDMMRPQQQRHSFWNQARHLDVLLLGASALIVMVVLAAWIV